MRNLWNIVLMIVFFLLMDYPLLGSVRHEYFGAAFLLLVLLHVSYAQGWLKTWFRGQQSAQRLLGTVVNLLLIVAMLVTIVTGLLISTTVFPVAQLRGAESILAHELHQSGAYVSFILTGIHLGLYWTSIWIRIKRRLGLASGKKYYQSAEYVLAVIIIGYTVYASFVNHMGDRIMMEHMMNLGTSGTPIQYSMDLVVIFTGYVASACICKKIIAR